MAIQGRSFPRSSFTQRILSQQLQCSSYHFGSMPKRIHSLHASACPGSSVQHSSAALRIDSVLSAAAPVRFKPCLVRALPRLVYAMPPRCRSGLIRSPSDLGSSMPLPFLAFLLVAFPLLCLYFPRIAFPVRFWDVLSGSTASQVRSRPFRRASDLVAAFPVPYQSRHHLAVTLRVLPGSRR